MHGTTYFVFLRHPKSFWPWPDYTTADAVRSPSHCCLPVFRLCVRLPRISNRLLRVPLPVCWPTIWCERVSARLLVGTSGCLLVSSRIGFASAVSSGTMPCHIDPDPRAGEIADSRIQDTGYIIRRTSIGRSRWNIDRKRGSGCLKKKVID